MAVNTEETLIMLASDGEDPFEEIPSFDSLRDEDVSSNLSQHSKVKGFDCDFLVVSERYVAVHAVRALSGNRRRETRYLVDLAYLDPEPRRYVRRDWKWLKIGAAFAAITAILIGLGFAGMGSMTFFWPATIVMGTAAAILILLFFIKSDDRLIFHARYARTPLVQILARNPSKAAVKRFVETIRLGIKHARKRHDNDNERLLKGELREHRRLRDEGILPEPIYQKVKRRILLRYQ
jgi:hypothetical protein